MGARRQAQLRAGKNGDQGVALQAHQPGHLDLKDLPQAVAHRLRDGLQLDQATQLHGKVSEGGRRFDAVGAVQAGVKHGSLEAPGATHLHRRDLLALGQQVERSGRHGEVGGRLVDPYPGVGGVESVLRWARARSASGTCHFLQLVTHRRAR